MCRQALRDLGYIHGENILIEDRFADGSEERLREYAAAAVRLRADVILAISSGAIRVSVKATRAMRREQCPRPAMTTCSMVDREPVRSRGMGVAVARTARGRGEVHLVRLDPTLGSEIQKTRPCLVVSPDELNRYLRPVIVASMTTGGQAYPWRVACRFQRRFGFVALDQIRTVDADCLVRRLGRVTPPMLMAVLQRLQEMFAE